MGRDFRQISADLGSRLQRTHELSCFVLQRAGAETEAVMFAPRDWQVAPTNEEALSRGAGPDPAPDTGFLSAYGATTAENDFNTYAEKIFTEPKVLVHLACTHKLVREKLLFVLETYVRLDSRMERVFDRLGIDRTDLCT